MMGGIESIMGGFGTVGMWMFLLLGTTLLALLVWALVAALQFGGRPVVVTSATFEDVLRERLERGEISAREFEDALQQLKDS